MLYEEEVYEGSWRNNQFNGKGKFYFDKTGFYEGDFVLGLFEGHGFEFYEDGTYEGGYHNDSKSGKGRLVYGNGSVYYGDFFDDSRHGKGFYYNSATGEKYV